MKKPQMSGARRRIGRQREASPPLCMLAFQSIILFTTLSATIATFTSVAPAHAIQVADQVAPGDVHSGAAAVAAAQTGPMLSMGSESSSALESSAALAGDDLIAAESSPSQSQSAEAAAAEHKSFTQAFARQEMSQQQQQQLAASVAPPQFAPPQASPQQQQQQLYNVHPQQHMAMRLPPHAQQQQGVHPQQQQSKPFNPFMAAALAGNYGLAQQQMAAAAAAAAAGLHARPHPGQQQVAPGGHHQVMASHQHQQHPQQQQQVQPHPHARQIVAADPQRPDQLASAMAAQETSIRQNVVPAPNFASSMVEANSIELNDSPQSGGQAQMGVGSTQLATASSVQHPVVASASSIHESGAQAWPLQAPDIPKIVNLEVKCEKNLMKVSIEFDKVFNGVIFSKGHYSQGQCLHVGQNSGKQQAYFDISINTCGTQGNTQNGLYGMGGNTGSGTYFENTIVVQYDPNVQEVYDHARKLRCTWHDQYEKAVTFRPFPVDMLDIVRADFAGDNVGCWMQIQVGKGPWASEVAGIVKIGQTMTMVLAIKDEENKFDMLVRNCFAHDGKRGPIELVDKSGCITRPKLMSRFTKIKNFGSSATVLSYAHFQAFKFPDSMEVHFQCTIQICRHQCPEQCSAGPNAIGGAASAGAGSGETYSESTISGTFNIHGSGQQSAGPDSVHLRKYGSSASSLSREKRDLRWAASSNGSHIGRQHQFNVKPMTQTVGLNRVIQVVSAGDLAFAIQQQSLNKSQAGSPEPFDASQASQLIKVDLSNQICMSSYNFVLSLVILVLILLCSCLAAIGLHLRQRSFAKRSGCGSTVSSKLLSATLSSPNSPNSSIIGHSMHSPSARPQQQQYQQQQQQFYGDQHRIMH